MDWNLIGTIIITALTVLGSSEAFKFYKSKLALKSKSMDLQGEYKEDLKKRVNRLEVLLTESSKEKPSELIAVTSVLSSSSLF